MRPNILFIMADQFRADAVGRVGGYTRTPHLDTLAESGWLFANVFANSAECVPSRISLATGLYPHQTGVDRNVECTLNPDYSNWMQAIAAAGYRTSLFGKTHLHPHAGDIRDRLPLMHRYGLQTVDETVGPRAAADVRSNLTDLWEARNVWDTYRADFKERFATKAFVARPSTLPLELYYDCYVGSSARNYLADLTGSAPWFCWVSFGGPHEPWDAPEPYASMYAPADMPPPLPRPRQGNRGLLNSLYSSSTASPQDLSAADVAAMRANYAGNVTLIDDEIGKIIETLRRRGELDRTLIVFTSDHGEMNGDYGLLYKANFLDPAIKVPLIIAPPRTGDAPMAGTDCADLVELMDVGATLIAYAEASLPRPSLAHSLRASMESPGSAHRSMAVSEFGGHSCVITQEIKVEFDPALNPLLAFDRLADPQEQKDVSQDPLYQRPIAELRLRLEAFRAATPAVSSAVDFPGIQP
jgi:arylsulfatase